MLVLSMLYNPCRDLSSRGKTEFGEDVFHVALRGSLGYYEFIGDGLVGQAFGDQVGDLTLTFCQACRVIAARRRRRGVFAQGKDHGLFEVHCRPLPIRRLNRMFAEYLADLLLAVFMVGKQVVEQHRGAAYGPAQSLGRGQQDGCTLCVAFADGDPRLRLQFNCDSKGFVQQSGWT